MNSLADTYHLSQAIYCKAEGFKQSAGIDLIFRNIVEFKVIYIPVHCSDHNVVADRKTKVLKTVQNEAK